jgi:hypothetical protein
MKKLRRLVIAYLATNLVFFIAELFFPVNYDGIVSIISIPMATLIINVFFIPLTWGLGFLLNRGRLRKIWNRMGWGVLAISAIGAGIYIFCRQLGLLEDSIGTAGQPIQVMKGYSWHISLFLLIYPLVNFPESRRDSP